MTRDKISKRDLQSDMSALARIENMRNSPFLGGDIQDSLEMRLDLVVKS
jgi:hypothetical protein